MYIRTHTVAEEEFAFSLSLPTENTQNVYNIYVAINVPSFLRLIVRGFISLRAATSSFAL